MLSLFRRGKLSAVRSVTAKVARLEDLPPPSTSRTAIADTAGSKATVCRSFSGSGSWRNSYYPELLHFRRRQSRRWYHNSRIVFVVVVVGTGVIVSVYYGHLEIVPYSKRKHFVLVSPALERQLGEAQFNQIKAALRGKILPPFHSNTIRVRLISQDIIDAVHRGLYHDELKWSDIDSETEQPSSEYGSYYSPEKSSEAVLLLTGRDGDEGKGDVDVMWSNDGELLDDEWVYKARKKGSDQKLQMATWHLEGLNWEVLVVKDDLVNAMCLPGGKIIVFTGLLDHFREDAEIATVIGHEVGHAIARHAAEMITKNLWFGLIQLILLQFFGMPDLINAMSTLILRLPFSRRMEIEADYIGLMLMASAGYDPQVAPRVYEKLGKITGDSTLKNYLSTHPSSKKRAQLLTQAKVMEEALSVYAETINGRQRVGGFL